MRVLYLDFDLSISQIEELTEYEWKQTSIIKALKEMGISKATKSSHAKYGEKVVCGDIVPHPREQKIIKTIMDMREKGLSFAKVALCLNQKKIRGKLGSTWSPKTVRDVVVREQKRRKEETV